MARISSENFSKLLLQVRRHEGLSLDAYQDTVGVWTVGYGHTKGVREGDSCSRFEAEQWLTRDLNDAARDATRLPGFDNLSDIRQAGLINMVFNLGLTKLLTWTNTMAALADQDWRGFHKHASDSMWVDQVKVRAHEVMAQIRHDRWMLFNYW